MAGRVPGRRGCGHQLIDRDRKWRREEEEEEEPEEEEEEEEEEEKPSRVGKSTMRRFCCRQQVFIRERARRAREDKTRLLSTERESDGTK